MRISILAFLILTLTACAFRSDDLASLPSPAAKTPTPAKANDLDSLVVPTIPTKPLNDSQRKELNAAIPTKAREVLQKADVLEVLGLTSENKAGIGWDPDLKAGLPLGELRRELLDAFFFDASAGINPSACFIPRHGLKATYKGKTIEVIICYQCHLFVVTGDFGKFNGGVYKDGAAAHHIFEEILRTKGVATR